ncbi:septal ring lytic transglycosylase RlpA family protein [Filimonas effusa]|nr:septal ring lytic transglycosylase RlpA family protein [Filimonas effusa]
MKIYTTLILCLLFSIPVWAQLQTKDTSSEKVAYGIASFYSKNLDSTRTATGEIFLNSKMTAASNHFKLNSWVRVTNLRNGKSVIVRINDRMHKRMVLRGRVVDLSRSAAEKLNFISSGLVRVKVVLVPPGTTE